METKPFSLQAPEAIAKEYGGNKQKIAQAAQMGLLDPTAAVMAGMFIDRMRGAMAQEQGTPPTVAQQVLAPQGGAPAPEGVAGILGAPPTPNGVPAMAPPAMPAPAPVQAPQGAPMGQGAAAPAFGGGGLVAFAEGGPAAPRQATDYGTPPTLYGVSADPRANLATLNSLYQPQTRRGAQLEQYYDRMLDPEQQRITRNRDMWQTLAQIGANMAASRSPYFLQAVGEAASQALPGARQVERERRGEEQAGLRALADMEGSANSQQAQRVAAAVEMVNRYGSYAEAMKDREFRMAMQDREFAQRVQLAIMEQGRGGGGGGGGSGGGGGERPPKPPTYAAQSQSARRILSQFEELADVELQNNQRHVLPDTPRYIQLKRQIVDNVLRRRNYDPAQIRSLAVGEGNITGNRSAPAVGAQVQPPTVHFGRFQ